MEACLLCSARTRALCVRPWEGPSTRRDVLLDAVGETGRGLKGAGLPPPVNSYLVSESYLRFPQDHRDPCPTLCKALPEEEGSEDSQVQLCAVAVS